MILKKDKLTVKIYTSTKDMSVSAALDVSSKIKELLSQNEYINMIFAAAPSQSDFFKELITYKDIDWGRINAFHLDEYINLNENAPQRFGNFLKKEIFGLLPFRNIYYLDGNKPIEEECKRYTALLEKYPPKIICLGIGENGHIAFNDPHVANFNDPETVKAVMLDERCRQQQVNDKCFDKIEDVPDKALTLTIPTLLSAEYLFCIVPFKSKAQAVYNMINGEITEACPASILRTKDNINLYLDKESSSLLVL
ncbi:glucosamine-6-phosphate deaminase [Dysgonomonas sp. Marseille-P4677]|uniref:glucosamine-6-phosphate deaminase n=1 Tax=Dysgonomonas sp. Marseille-P4677 TaxID=2364790 RepID=UPI001911DAFE|nr:glucosamine-6-phosphate deaminase [Dysgonomonas sp. Marseille-P4677]MBK5720997.1 glucosamine-6-phosphate deaminase [Dysgonomonas sp. Marseille-P4677]